MLPLSVFQSVFDSSPVGEYLLSPDATILAVNEAFLKTAGRKREDLIGVNLFVAFPESPDDPQDTGVAALRKSLARVIATGKPDTLALQRYPIRVTAPDGSERYEERFWSAVSTPIFDSGGRLLCISHSTMDVTDLVAMKAKTTEAAGAEEERARLEAGMFTRAQTIAEINKALQAERSRLHHLFEHAPGFVYFTRGPQHVIEQANEALYELVGLRDVVGKTIQDVFPDMTGQGFYELLDEVYRSGQPYIGNANRVMLRKSPDGPLVETYVDFVFQPIVDAEGVVIGICAQGNDITEKKRIEEELRSTAARQAFQLKLSDCLRELSDPADITATACALLGQQLGVARVGYVEVDDGGETITLKPDWTNGELPSASGATRAFDDFGPSIAAALRAGRVLAVSDIAADERSAPYARAYSDFGVRAFLAVPLMKAGRLRAVLHIHQPKVHPWTGQDVALAEDMVERTWAAAERAYAEEELREASRRKDEFLAMLAHELRNPLAPISAAAELMELVQLDEAGLKQTSQVISRQVTHMTGLIDDLLDVSRVTRGLVAIDKSPQDLKNIVSNAVEQVRPIMESQHHHLGIDLAPESAHVLGDQKRLVQILTNLLNNAAKYTPAGGNIQLRMEVHDDKVLLHVVDNGIGITPELQARVFDLFAQAERTADRSQGGLGLGLALVKSLAELHGGKVTCLSEGLGKGSCFTVCLPRLAEQNTLPDRRQSKRNVHMASQKLRILVVDDNADVARMLAMLLEATGHDVLVEHESRQGLERARIETPDVCVLDIGLPDMDGNELARRLRAQPETAKAVLIAVTGYGQEQDRKSALAAGFNHHLVKPVDPARLTALLNEIGRY
jgi:PAS domain S-box-containing protein